MFWSQQGAVASFQVFVGAKEYSMGKLLSSSAYVMGLILQILITGKERL
jgi:hypothetical protein